MTHVQTKHKNLNEFAPCEIKFKDLLTDLFLNQSREMIEKKFGKNLYRNNRLLLEGKKRGSFHKFSHSLSQIRGGLENNTGVLLEAGCGFGLHALFWGNSGYEVCAFDISRQTIKVFDALLNDCDKKIPCYPLVSDALNIPLPEQSADIIYANEFISHVPDLSKSLREFARILRPGGELIICDTDKKSLFSFVIWPRQIKAERRYAAMRKKIVKELLEREHLTLNDNEVNRIVRETIGLTKKEIEQVARLFTKTPTVKNVIGAFKLREPFNSEFKCRSPYGQYSERLFTPEQISILLQNNFERIQVFYPTASSPFSHFVSFKIIKFVDKTLPASIPLLSATLVGKYVIVCRRKKASVRHNVEKSSVNTEVSANAGKKAPSQKE